jgi:hypothetical protein
MSRDYIRENACIRDPQARHSMHTELIVNYTCIMFRSHATTRRIVVCCANALSDEGVQFLITVSGRNQIILHLVPVHTHLFSQFHCKAESLPRDLEISGMREEPEVYLRVRMRVARKKLDRARRFGLQWNANEREEALGLLGCDISGFMGNGHDFNVGECFAVGMLKGGLCMIP